jgi:hypothetical protein
VLTDSRAPEPPTAAPAADETPTVLAHPNPPDEASPDGATAWASVPPLLTSDDLDTVPFAMTAAPTAPDESAAEPDSSLASAPAPDGLPDYDTPDVERPAIHLVKPPLPDYDTPDEEQPTVHPAPISSAPLTPLALSTGPVAANGANADDDDDDDDDDGFESDDGFDTHDAPTIAGDASALAGLDDVAPSYPETYASPHAARVDRAAFTPLSAAAPSATLPPALPSHPAAGNDPIERFFGAQPPPKGRVATNAIQRLWLRFLPPEWATAPWISIPVGALLALVAGLLASIIGLLLWDRAIGYLLDASGVLGASANLIHAVLTPNLLQLLLLEHSVPMALALGAPGATGSFSALITLPLTGLSLIPAIALVLGGYVAAASDFSHRLRFSVLRGALIGPVYAILLLLVALFGSSDARLGGIAVVQLHPSVGVAILTGLLWGTLLGALGGLLAIRRHHLFTTNRHPDVLAGASWGALIALGSGALLALVALAAGVVAHAVGTVPVAAGQAGGGVGGALNALLVGLALVIVIAPVAALWLFTLGMGANIESWLSAVGVNAHPGTTSFGLLVAQNHPDSVVWWLLLLIPLASYIIGGRAAAHIARADSVRDGALAGWLMAVALSLLLLLLTLLSRIVILSEATLVGQSITTNLGIAPASLAVFLLALLVGSIAGAFGGASAVLVPQPGPTISWHIAPLLARVEPALTLAQRPWDLFDAARGRPTPHTPLRALLYAALLAAVTLLALFFVVALLGWVASHFAPISAVRGVDGFFLGLAVGVPLLLLASAAILVALRALPPLLRKPPADAPVLPRYPTSR